MRNVHTILAVLALSRRTSTVVTVHRPVGRGAGATGLLRGPPATSCRAPFFPGGFFTCPLLLVTDSMPALPYLGLQSDPVSHHLIRSPHPMPWVRHRLHLHTDPLATMPAIP